MLSQYHEVLVHRMVFIKNTIDHDVTVLVYQIWLKQASYTTSNPFCQVLCLEVKRILNVLVVVSQYSNVKRAVMH